MTTSFQAFQMKKKLFQFLFKNKKPKTYNVCKLFEGGILLFCAQLRYFNKKKLL